MKNLNLSTRKALRHAASASLALVAMVSSALAQSPVTHSVTLRTGNDYNNNNTLIAGDEDGSISMLNLGAPSGGSAFTLTQAEFDGAVWGDRAVVITPHSGWGTNFSCSDAQWVHSDHNPNAADGSGTNDTSVLYAHPFDLPANMPLDASVQVQIEWQADDLLQGSYFGSAYSQTSLGISGGGHQASTTQSLSGTAGSLGLNAGRNTFFFHQETTSNQRWAGIRYCLTLTVEYCAIETELRSGMRFSPTHGWLPFATGTTVPYVRAVTLPEVYTGSDLISAFSILGQPNGGGTAVTVNPNSAWGTLSQPTQWINSSMPAVGGDHDRSALYALDFVLPATLPQNLVATLDLEWESDDRLAQAFMNGQGGVLNLVNSSAMVGPNSYNLPTTSSTTGSVSDLFLNPGLNTLYLLQQDVDDQISGINYLAMLRITVPCENTPSEPFCDCMGAISPCGNQGLTYEEGCANSTGQGASLTSSGQALMGGSSSLSLHADKLPSGSIGLFFQGDSIIGPAIFGDGLRCVGGNIVRLGIGFEDGTGRADLGVIGAPASSGLKFYQLWYRDTPSASSPCHTGFNLSNGLALGWY